MLDFLSMLAGSLVSVFKLLINSVQALIEFFRLIFEFIAYLLLVLGELPPPLVAFAGLGIFLSVLLLIVGRN